MGCAVSPAGRWRVTRQVALRIRYPKPCTEAMRPSNCFFSRTSQAPPRSFYSQGKRPWSPGRGLPSRALKALGSPKAPKKPPSARNGPFPFKNDLFLVCSTIAEIRAKFDHFGPQMGRWARNGPFPKGNDLFVVYSTIAESRAKFDHFGPQKGRWARNGFFLVCSTKAEIRGKFYHFGPQKGRWARNGPFPFKNDFFLVYSTIAEIRAKFDHFEPERGRWARNGPFQIRNSHHKLPGPDKIVVQDWKHPVRAPSKETKGLEPPPNPNWHPSGLDKSSLQTQIQLFKIGSIQLRHRLKKTKGLEPPPNPNRHPSGLDRSSLQTQIQLFKIGSNQAGHRLKKTKGLEPSQTETGTRLLWTSPACRRKSNVRDWKQPVRAPSEENQRPRATSKPKLASVWSGQVQLADPNPVVRDWKHPARAPSEENQRPRATPKPKLAPVWSGQVQLADPNPVVRDWRHPVRSQSEENYRPRATPGPKLAPLVLTSPASSKRDRCKEQLRGQERDQSSREP